MQMEENVMGFYDILPIYHNGRKLIHNMQSSQGSFVSLGRHDILTTTIGTEEHPSRVWTVGFGVGVRQYFGLDPHSSSFVNPQMMEELAAKLTQRLKPELTQQIREQVTDEIKMN